jgi:hypothetical protein
MEEYGVRSAYCPFCGTSDRFNVATSFGVGNLAVPRLTRTAPPGILV